VSKDGEPRYRTIEWLMWQMGGPGPMFGQVHFVKYNKARRPTRRSAISEAHRLYGVLDKRRRPRVRRRPVFDRDTAIWPWVRATNGRPSTSTSTQRQALVHDHRQAPGGAEGLGCPDVGEVPIPA
jgi:GST-like protein